MDDARAPTPRYFEDFEPGGLVVRGPFARAAVTGSRQHRGAVRMPGRMCIFLRRPAA